jgi:hypothetical protein
MTEKIRSACLNCHKGVETAHDKWLPNAGLHLSAVACAACHAPNSNRGIVLRLYDENTGKAFTDEELSKLLGRDYARLKEKVNVHGEGISSDELWNVVSVLNSKGTDARITFMGKMEVGSGIEAHQLAVRKNAVRDCESCHYEGSDFFRNVTVAVVKADGKVIKYKAKPEVLGSMLSLRSLRDFYVLGSTRIKLLDWLGILMVAGGIMLPVAHLTTRILTSPVREAKKLNKMRKEGRR